MIYTSMMNFFGMVLCKCISNVYIHMSCNRKLQSQNIHDMKCKSKNFGVFVNDLHLHSFTWHVKWLHTLTHTTLKKTWTCFWLGGGRVVCSVYFWDLFLLNPNLKKLFMEQIPKFARFEFFFPNHQMFMINFSR